VLGNGPVVSIGDTLRSTAAPAGIPVPPASKQVRSLEDSERDHIRRALIVAEGRVQGPLGAAEMLGVNPSTLRSRMQKLGITSKSVQS
jgi:transcriptional regulator with GAF, ATPase, and Fis domain